MKNYQAVEAATSNVCSRFNFEGDWIKLFKSFGAMLYEEGYKVGHRKGFTSGVAVGAGGFTALFLAVNVLPDLIKEKKKEKEEPVKTTFRPGYYTTNYANYCTPRNKYSSYNESDD